MMSEKETSLPEYPERREGIEAIPVHEDLVLYDGKARNGISLNKTARKVWEMSDGSRTLDAMVEEFAGQLEISDSDVLAELRGDLEATLMHFQANELLK